jgi:precorrin-6A/cobalt-precorrin-6A reductase
MKLLLLGGTADGRCLAEALHQHNIDVIYSIAGLVRIPQVACNIVSGGFTQFGGLADFIETEKITAILDATHPYAQNMSVNAVNAAKACHIPCWRFHRQEWQVQGGDDWQFVSHWQAALPLLVGKKSVLLSAGQLEQKFIDSLGSNSQQQQLLRTAVQPKTILPPTMQWVKAIGPFAYENEFALMQNHKTDVLVSKNSGGDSTVAKLKAARMLTIPVIMLKRPELPNADTLFFTREACIEFILNQNNDKKS